MFKTDHWLLCSAGANAFAKEMGVTTVSTEDLVTQEARDEHQKIMKYKTAVTTNFALNSASQ